MAERKYKTKDTSHKRHFVIKEVVSKRREKE